MSSQELREELAKMAERLRCIREEDDRGWVPEVMRLLFELEQKIRATSFELTQ